MEILLSMGFIIIPIIMCLISHSIEGNDGTGLVYGFEFFLYYQIIKPMIGSQILADTRYLRICLIMGMMIYLYYGLWTIIVCRIKNLREHKK